MPKTILSSKGADENVDLLLALCAAPYDLSESLAKVKLSRPYQTSALQMLRVLHVV